MYMERMIGWIGKLGRKVDIGRKMNDPMELQNFGLVFLIYNLLDLKSK